VSASSSVPAPPRNDGLRAASGLRGIPPYRWIDLGLVIVLALIASILFVPPFGSPVGARAAAIGIGAGAVVAVVCLVGRLGPAPTLALTALVHVGAGPWVLPDTGSGWEAGRAGPGGSPRSARIRTYTYPQTTTSTTAPPLAKRQRVKNPPRTM